jgi:hypothetical protein
MPEANNRRAEAQARALLGRAEATAARASFHLFKGDPLSAMRLLRAAEQLNQLDSRLRLKRDTERRSRMAREESAMRARERECQRREEQQERSRRQIDERWTEVRQVEATVSAAYKLMREGKLDGPPPATDEEIISGVAPL